MQGCNRGSVFLVVVLVSVLGGMAMASEDHPFGISDMLAMDRLGGPQVSPDGSTVVFTRRTTDLEADRGRTDLWRVGTDGSGLARWTADPASDYQARWSAGGDLYFLSSRGGSSQVWKMPAVGGEAQAVTDLPLDVGSFAIVPGATRLIVSMDVFVDCDTLACTVNRLAARESNPASGQSYDQLFVRHWDGWKDGRRSHLFSVRLDDDGASVPADLMRGMDADTPTRPFGGPEDYTVSPDGKAVVFSARDVGVEESWSTDFDLYQVAIDGSHEPTNLTESNPAWDAAPVFSPDGSSLAYLAMARPGFEADRFRVILRDSKTGNTRVLAEDWDRSPGSMAWSRDGKRLLISAANVGQRSLFALNPAGGDPVILIEQGSVHGFGDAGDSGIVYSMSHLSGPAEIYRRDSEGKSSRLTTINDARLALARMGSAEQFAFRGWNDEKVYAYALTPADFDPAKKYPIAFLVHGGPQGSFGNSFHYRWNPQAYAGAGYAVVMVDFHGSTGYGQAFTDSITGDWGGKPLVDLQKGLAAALTRFPWMDGDNVCALGASYGGYMMNWIAGKWSDRFKCLVNHDGVFDTRAMYYETEELWFPEWENGGTPWEVPQNFEEFNPARFVDNWRTPMLVIHGALDYRVPESQGLGAFTALQRRGVPSKLLFYPDENHWVLRPSNSEQWHETVLDWLQRWTRNAETP
ncbi:MAG: S9 family peptidase [Acidobacteriota bacterium]|nr:S9 family peptidase [Acidobacteriota bacterium]MDH3784325.1 S9 family peptidase [Acidobacteriota bacterium]